MAEAMSGGGSIPVIILKEGTSRTRGGDALRNNITAAKIISELVRSSLGPRGMDKMLVDTLGDVTITNDGATMLKEIDVQHPAAKMMVEISKATDNEVGDGTTSAVVLAGSLLERAEELLAKDVHPTVIVGGYRKASTQALKVLENVAVKLDPTDKEWLNWLKKVARTSMLSKLVSKESEQLAELIVDAVLTVADKFDGRYKVDTDNIKVEKKPGGSLRDTKVVRGVAMDKEVVHSGMPKKAEQAKIALINSPFEIEKTEFDAKININNPEQMKAFLEEESRILKSMVDKIEEVGANVVICQKGIDDVAQHYLAKAGILAVRRAMESDMNRLAKATGGRVVTSFEDLSAGDLGYAGVVEERKIEEDKWVFVEGSKNPKAVTVLIRGGSQRVVDEADRSIHDALMVVKDVLEKPAIVAGGGAPEAYMAHELRQWTQTLGGREQLAAQKFAEALESIPLALAENAGMDPIDVQVELRARQAEGKTWYGVDVLNTKLGDLYERNIFEPLVVKEQIVKAATESACMILRIDDVIAATKPKEGPRPPMPGGEGMGGGMGGFG